MEKNTVLHTFRIIRAATLICIIITSTHTLLLAQYSLIPNAVSPYNINNLNDNTVIPPVIINLMVEQGLFNDLNLDTNNNGDYIGILIMIKPDELDNLLPDNKLKGFITILDREGLYTPQKQKMAWWEKHKVLIWIWNAKDQYGHYVNPGIYNCIIDAEDLTPSLYPEGGGPKVTLRLQVGVKGAGSDSCGDCGTSAELAFIPPVGFKIASMVKRRKKWWHKFFGQLILK